MSSSGLLCLGIVLLWAFAAVPAWVVRRERLAHVFAEQEEARALLALDRRAERAERAERAKTSVRLLGTPNPAAAVGVRANATAPVATGKGNRSGAAPTPPASSTAAGLLLLVAGGSLVAAPAVLALIGLAPMVLAPSGVVALLIGAVVLRARATARARAVARERALVRERSLAQGRAQVRAAQARAGARRAAVEEAAAQEAASVASRQAALRAAQGARRRAVGE